MSTVKDDGTAEEPRQPRLVEDVIAACASTNATRRDLHRIHTLVLHRTSLSRNTPANPLPVSDLELDGPALAKRFRVRGMGTGGETPYHFLVLIDGTVQQLLPLHVMGSHAKSHNYESIGVAVVGTNLEKSPPLHIQEDALIRLVAVLLGFNGGLRVVGHTDLHGASKDPDKVCPGPFIVPAAIAARALVYAPPKHLIPVVMAEAGVVL